MNIYVAGKKYTVEFWKGDELPDLSGESYLGIDTETEMIVDGEPVKPVIMQVAWPNKRLVHIIWHELIHEYMDALALDKNFGIKVAMHTAGFDLKVIGHSTLWELADNDQIIDVAIRWLHKKLSEGLDPPKRFNLGVIAQEMLHKTLDKDGDVRTTFKQDEPPSDEHVLYAAEDAAVTAELVNVMPDEYPGEAYQTKGYIALRVAADNGMYVDGTYLKEIGAKFEKRLATVTRVVNRFGVHPGEKGQKKRIQELMESYERMYGLKFERTEKTREISVNGKAQVLFQDKGLDPPPFLDNYLKMNHYQKFLATYLDESMVSGDGRVHPYFVPVMRTGRASCQRPNLMNVPREENVRAIFSAPPGHVLVAADYGQLELCILAETCYQMYGQSSMRDIINSGVDLHSWFGAKIKENSSNVDESTNFRQMAKAANFGFPGGLGVDNFIAYARNQYGVEITEDMAKHLKKLWLESFPEMERYLQPALDIDTTQRHIREVCSCLLPGRSIAVDLRELRAMLYQENYDKDSVRDIIRRTQRYQTTTITGRIRPDCGYNDACNYAFQSAAADGAKLSLYNVMRAGFKIVNFVHDEIICEVKFNEKLHDNVLEIAAIMVKEMKSICLNTDIKVEYAVMKSWDKSAKWVYTDDGKITVWTPDIIKASNEDLKLNKQEAAVIAKGSVRRPVYTPSGVLFGWQPLKTILTI